MAISDDEKKFVATVERVFTDHSFASSMEKDPVAALESAGFKLSPAQQKSVKAGHPTSELKIPTTKPVVTILTKGTQPAVQVLVNSIVFVGGTEGSEKG